LIPIDKIDLFLVCSAASVEYFMLSLDEIEQVQQ